MPATQPQRHLLTLDEIDQGTWELLLSAAETLGGPAGRERRLRGRRVAMVFFQPSLRTRVAFEVAALDLGAHALHLQVGGGLWVLEFRDGLRMDGEAAEHVEEAFGVLSQMVDLVGVRCFAGLEDAAKDDQDLLLRSISAASQVPILSLESAVDHPHQGLADALAIRRRFGRRRVKITLTWAPHVKPLPLAVPHAALLAFAREGHQITLAHPPGFEPSPAILERVGRLAAAQGGEVRHTTTQASALSGADVVYAKSWGARGHYGDLEAGRRAVQAHGDWILTRQKVGAAAFMHCLPIRREVVAETAVIRAGTALILDQARARLDVQKATLCWALGAL